MTQYCDTNAMFSQNPIQAEHNENLPSAPPRPPMMNQITFSPPNLSLADAGISIYSPSQNIRSMEEYKDQFSDKAPSSVFGDLTNIAPIRQDERSTIDRGEFLDGFFSKAQMAPLDSKCIH